MKILTKCPSSLRQYDTSSYRPGSRFRCHCNVIVEVPKQQQSHSATVVRCSSCGGPRDSSKTDCGFCGASFTLHEQDLQTICPSCMTRISSHAKFCHSCGEIIDAQETLGEKSTLSCPACKPETKLHSRPMARIGGSLLECGRCAGMWLSHQLFSLLIEKSDELKITTTYSSPQTAKTSQDSTVVYRKCPYCIEMMNRKNFGKISGVIIDICKNHGVWFDHSELDRILLWVKNGGLRKAAARENEDHRRLLSRIENAKMQRSYSVEASSDESTVDFFDWTLLFLE